MKHLAMTIMVMALTTSGEVIAEDDFCQKVDEVADGTYFTATVKTGRKLSSSLCELYTENMMEQSTAKIPYFEEWKVNLTKEAAKLINIYADKDGDDASTLEKNKTNRKAVSHQVDTFIHNYHELNGKVLDVIYDDDNDNVNFYTSHKENLALFDNQKCMPDFNTECRNIVNEYKTALELPYNRIKKSISITKSEELGMTSANWQRFFENRRSMNTIELAANTWLYRDELRSNKNIEPPQWQLVLAHVNPIMQYSPEEVDGNRVDEALMVEWVGVNFWDLRIPLGLSVASTFQEKSVGNDVTTGLLLNINNDYSIGVTDIGGENNIMISFDLMKLFEDKKSNFKDYISSAKKFF